MSKFLTKEDIRKISDMYKKGYSYNELSKLFDICTWSIANALKKTNTNSRIRKYICNENYFEKIDTKDKAYWLGFLFADGYVRNRKQSHNKHKMGGHVGLRLKRTDEKHLIKFLSNLDSNYKMHRGVIKKDKKFGFKKSLYYSSEINIYSSKMVNDLIDKGCVPNKSLILNAPIIQEKFYNHFIRGYFDGDGSVGYYKSRKYKRFKIGFLGTYKLLEWILNIFAQEGIIKYPKISSPTKKSKIHKIQFNSQKDIKLIKKYLYKNCGENFLHRKKEIFYTC